MGCPTSRRKPLRSLNRGRSWCCSFPAVASSPDHILSAHKLVESVHKTAAIVAHPNSLPTSPQSARSSGLNYVVGRIDRILSPGRVSPIVESYPNPAEFPLDHGTAIPKLRSAEKQRTVALAPPLPSPPSSPPPGTDEFDVRLNLRGRQGGGLVLEMNSGVLIENSRVFAGLICEHRDKAEDGRDGVSKRRFCRIEVSEVDNLSVFRETIELMFEENIIKYLTKAGAYHAIAILEVSANIMFKRGILSCLKYLEAVPWTEEEEEKLRNLLSVLKFSDSATKDILDRLYKDSLSESNQNLTGDLVKSITSCADSNARNELKLLVKGLLCKSSVYQKVHCELNKDDIYAICCSCLNSLMNLFVEACASESHKTLKEDRKSKPLIERISKEVDNLIWLLEILLERQMGEEFVEFWANQHELLRLHETASPMVRYEVSRVSAMLFIAMGTRKLCCRSEVRATLFRSWFFPMLLDFGWLQRCKKGLDIKALEEGMGQTLLTLPLKQQYALFMEWFRCFSRHGTECPNLSKAFQIWWRRSFLRGSETHCIESR